MKLLCEVWNHGHMLKVIAHAGTHINNLWLHLAECFLPGNMSKLTRVRKAGGDEEQALTSPRRIFQSHGRSGRKKTVKEMDATEADVDMPGLSRSQRFQGCFSPVSFIVVVVVVVVIEA